MFLPRLLNLIIDAILPLFGKRQLHAGVQYFLGLLVMQLATVVPIGSAHMLLQVDWYFLINSLRLLYISGANFVRHSLVKEVYTKFRCHHQQGDWIEVD